MFAKQQPATQAERAAIRQSVQTTFKDPYSVRDARISNVMFYTKNGRSSDRYVCISANAKNSYGAYVGIQFSEYRLRNGSVVEVLDNRKEGACLYARLRYAPFPELNGRG